MELCRQYGSIFICEILLVLNSKSYSSNLHSNPAAYYIYAIQRGFNIVRKKILTMLAFIKCDITKGKEYVTFVFKTKYKVKH